MMNNYVAEIGDSFGGLYAISERVFGDSLDELGEAEMQQLLPLLAAKGAAWVRDRNQRATK